MRIALILLLLAGCVSPEQRAERQMSAYGPYCDKLGYQRETDKWRDCVQTQAGNAQAAASRASAAAIQSRPKTCNQNGCY